MARFRRLAKQDRFSPEKQEFQPVLGAPNPLPKPDPAKAKRRKPKLSTQTAPKKPPFPS